MEKETKRDNATATVTIKYTKEQLTKSERYAKRRDLIGALLQDNVCYTIDEVETAIQNYMKGKVM